MGFWKRKDKVVVKDYDDYFSDKAIELVKWSAVARSRPQAIRIKRVADRVEANHRYENRRMIDDRGMHYGGCTRRPTPLGLIRLGEGYERPAPPPTRLLREGEKP